MRRQHGRVGLLGLVVASLGLVGVASADITTERSASILVWPKVIADGSRDTIIQVTNTSNSLVRAHCFYVNAAPSDTFPFLPQWIETDFDITLTKQQPTVWQVSVGRTVNPTDPVCGPGNTTCPTAGFDPGLIPPVVPDFVGELKCIEVDDSGAPLAGNHLKGEATIVTPAFDNDVSKYNAIGVLGTENNGDGLLVLGGGQCVGDGPENGAVCGSDDDCGSSGPCAPEYNACPSVWIVNHLADDAPDPAIEALGGGPSEVSTELTVVPCTQNYETQEPVTVTLQFLTTNEFESPFSVSTSVQCWGNFELDEELSTALTFDGQLAGQPPSNFPLGTMYLQTRIRSAGGTPYGVFIVAEEFHEDVFGNTATAAMNLHIEGERPNPDLITIPGEQIAP